MLGRKLPSQYNVECFGEVGYKVIQPRWMGSNVTQFSRTKLPFMTVFSYVIT